MKVSNTILSMEHFPFDDAKVRRIPNASKFFA